MATTQLRIYNRALRALEETRLSALTDNRPIRHEMDEVWTDDLRVRCLEKGLWNFATRTVEASYDPDVNPSFGHAYAFSKPTDWLRTAAVGQDEFFAMPLVQYEDEGNHLYCGLQTIYWKYISKDSEYGLNLDAWTALFAEAVGLHLALQVAPGRLNRAELSDLRKDERDAFVNARSKDAMNEPAKFPAEGRWTRSRRGFRSNLDRGSTSSLIG